MNTLRADFEKHFPGGTVIRAGCERPADGFSVMILFGPSGCGKTTVLRCLAGLERPEHGTIQHAGQTWLDTTNGIHLPPQKRGVGFLFQDYALFPHLNVADNIRYGLGGGREARRRTGELLEMLQLSGLESRYPGQLSGGQQQRVALARAVARRPRLLLLDEPLSALDTPTAEQLRRDLRRLLGAFEIPCFIVTHDRLEAMALGDSVMVMEEGVVRQQGLIEDVFSRPIDERVARMVGVETVIPASIVEISRGLATLSVGAARLTAVAPVQSRGEVFICIRGEDVTIHKNAAEPSSARNRLPARVVQMINEGPIARVTLDCGFSLIALITRSAATELDLREGDSVVAAIKAPAIHILERS